MSSYCNYKCTSFTWYKVGDLYQIDNKFTITLEDKEYRYILTIYPGFRTDGGSVPKLFQWYLPAWNDNNPLYNIARYLSRWNVWK